jgi:hypothetical protein
MTATSGRALETNRAGRPRSGKATTILGVSFSLLFFAGGLLLMGYASSWVGFEFWSFLMGILCCSFALFIPTSIISWIDGA